jgi:hypothetical protein
VPKPPSELARDKRAPVVRLLSVRLRRIIGLAERMHLPRFRRVTRATYKLAWPDGARTTITVVVGQGKKAALQIAGARRASFASLHDYTTGAAIEAQLRLLMAQHQLLLE